MRKKHSKRTKYHKIMQKLNKITLAIKGNKKSQRSTMKMFTVNYKLRSM